LERQRLNELLKLSGLSKKEFSKLLGVSYNTVNGWGSPQNVPYWVESWLKLYIEHKECEELKQILKATVCKDKL
jgi:transposase